MTHPRNRPARLISSNDTRHKTMQTIDPVKPQTTAEIIREAKREDKDMRMFVLFRSGPGSEVVAVGRSYPQMWENAERDLGENRKELIKRSYTFDVMSAREAAELVA